MIEIIQIPLLSDNYSYIIRDKNTNITGCVDPSVAKDVANVLQNRGIDLNFILNTHHRRKLALRHFLGIHNYFTFKLP